MMAIVVPLMLALGLAADVSTGRFADGLAAAPVVAMLQEAEADGTAAAELPQGTAGLPPRAAPPRTMHEKWPVFVLFAASWVGIVAYLLVTGRRAERLARDVAAREGGR